MTDGDHSYKNPFPYKRNYIHVVHGLLRTCRDTCNINLLLHVHVVKPEITNIWNLA